MKRHYRRRRKRKFLCSQSLADYKAVMARCLAYNGPPPWDEGMDSTPAPCPSCRASATSSFGERHGGTDAMDNLRQQKVRSSHFCSYTPGASTERVKRFARQAEHVRQGRQQERQLERLGLSTSVVRPAKPTRKAGVPARKVRARERSWLEQELELTRGHC